MDVYELGKIGTGKICNEMVFLDDSFAILCPYTPLNSRIKAVLKKVHINRLFTKGVFSDEIEKSMEDIINDKNFEDIQSYVETRKLHDSFYEEFKTIYKSIEEKNAFEYEHLNNLIYNKIYPEVRKNPHFFLVIDNPNDESLTDYKYYSLRNLIFTLSILEADLSKKVQGSNQKIQIAIATSLLDIGVLPIIKKLEGEGKPITVNIRNTKVLPVIHKVTNRILERSFVPPSIVKLTEQINILNSNNSKTNNKVKIQKAESNTVAEMAQVAFMLMWYVHLTTPLPNHEHMNPSAAIQVLTKNAEILFEKSLVKMLINTIGFIPPGTYVELENKSIAFVYKADKTNIKSPLVILLKDTEGVEKSEISIISTFPAGLTISRIIYDQKEIDALKEIKEYLLSKIRSSTHKNL